jgi:hypothetical protein
MRKERRRDELLASTNLNTNVVVNSDLLPLLADLVDFVLDLGRASSNVPASRDSESSLSIDHANLVNAVIAATADILKSPTIAYINNLVQTSTLLSDLLGGCSCVDALELGSLVHYLDKVIEAALAIQKWCGHNPVTVPSGPGHVSSPPTSLQNTSSNATVLSLDDLLAALGLSPVKSEVHVGGLGPGLNLPLNDLLNSLGMGPANIHPRAVDHASTNINANTNVQVDQAFVNHIKALVTLVVVLKNDSPLPAPALDSPSIVLPVLASISVPLPPVDEHLVDAIIQATANLLQSAYVSSLLDNLSALIDVNSLVANTLAGCDCVEDLGLARFIENLNKVLAATLGVKDWCAHHPIVVGPTPSGSSSVPGPHSHGHNDILGIPINLGLDDLLAALGLNVKSNVDANVELQDAVNSLVQLVLNLQSGSTSLPQSPSSPSLVDALVQATGSLLRSLTGPELLFNIDALLQTTASLGDTLSGDGLGLGHLAEDVNEILKATLGIKSWCGDHGYSASPDSGSSSGGSGHGSGASPVIINAEDLLKSLGLENLVKVDGIVGGLGDAFSQPVNTLLGSLGLGGVKRWFGQ